MSKAGHKKFPHLIKEKCESSVVWNTVVSLLETLSRKVENIFEINCANGGVPVQLYL